MIFVCFLFLCLPAYSITADQNYTISVKLGDEAMNRKKYEEAIDNYKQALKSVRLTTEQKAIVDKKIKEARARIKPKVSCDLSVGNEYVYFNTSNAGVRTVNVRTNNPKGWKIDSKHPEWISVSKSKSGAGVEISVYKNRKIQERTGKIVISPIGCSKPQRTIYVTQRGVDVFLNLPSTGTGFAPDGGSVDFKVETNDEWYKATCPATWIRVYKNNGNTITVFCDKYKERKDRNAVIMVTTKDGHQAAYSIVQYGRSSSWIYGVGGRLGYSAELEFLMRNENGLRFDFSVGKWNSTAGGLSGVVDYALWGRDNPLSLYVGCGLGLAIVDESGFSLLTNVALEYKFSHLAVGVDWKPYLLDISGDSGFGENGRFKSFNANVRWYFE